MKDGNGPDRPHKKGRPARGFLGAALLSVMVAAAVSMGAPLAFAQSSTAFTGATGATGATKTDATPASAAPSRPAPPPPAAIPYKLSVAVGPAYAWGKGAARWAELVAERSGGRIAMMVFPGASATGGDPLQEFVGLRQGSIDFAVGSSMYWAGYVKPLNLFALPFLIPDSNALDALTGGPVGAALFKAIEDAGVVPLAWGDNEPHALSTSSKSIRKPDDVRGLRLRVTGSTPVEEAFRALGASQARYRWIDAQNAMLGGTIDGQETAAQSFVATKAHTLNQKHLTLWAIAAEPLIFAASRAAWERLAATDRELVRQAAIDAAKMQVDASRAATAAAITSLGREFRAANVEIVRLTAEERGAFVAATKPVYERWANEIGVDLVRQAEQAVAGVSAKR